MKPQITKAFFPSGQFKNRKGKKKNKHLIQNQEKRLWASQAVGLSTLRTHSHICSENSETDAKAHRLCAWDGGGPWSPVCTDQRAEMRTAAPLPTTMAQGLLCTHRSARGSPHPRRCTKHLLLPQLRPGSLKANLGKSHKLPFSRTEFLPAHW